MKLDLDVYFHLIAWDRQDNKSVAAYWTELFMFVWVQTNLNGTSTKLIWTSNEHCSKQKIVQLYTKSFSFDLESVRSQLFLVNILKMKRRNFSVAWVLEVNCWPDFLIKNRLNMLFKWIPSQRKRVFQLIMQVCQLMPPKGKFVI